jgi:23S rRNA pseudouridine1911/1915/1917 synthase
VSTTPAEEPHQKHRIEVREDTNDRLDRYLADRLHLSRTRVASLTERGLVLLNGRRVGKSYRPSAGDTFIVSVPALREHGLAPEPIPLDIVFEDAHLLVVNKPAGLVVHPAAGHRSGTLVNALLHHVAELSDWSDSDRPGIVHRLDKDTSGLMVVAKNEAVHRSLSEDLARRRVRRGYVAASWGHLQETERTIEGPVGRDPTDRKRMAVVPGGKSAITHVRVLESWPAAELLAVRLGTGRTHQIRVHLRSCGHPIVSDPIYAPGWENGFGGAGGRWAAEFAHRSGRLFLHAAQLAFRHPESGLAMKFRSPLPEPLSSALEWARGPS